MFRIFRVAEARIGDAGEPSNRASSSLEKDDLSRSYSIRSRSKNPRSNIHRFFVKTISSVNES
jgi:hypothetical protein